MGGGWVGYHPQQIATLLAGTVEAAGALGRLHADAPEAEDALARIRSVRLDLEIGLIPLLARIIASDVLLSSSPGIGVAAVAVGDEMADQAHDVIDGDGDALDELEQLLATHGNDLTTMRAFFDELGGDRVAELLIVLGSSFDPDDGQSLSVAERLCAVLGEVSAMSRFPAGTFADDLMAQFVERRDDGGVNAAATLSFVLRAADLSTALSVGLVRAMLDHERASREDDTLAWPLGFSVGSVFNREVPDDELWSTDDPRYAAMAALTRDGDAARAIFTDPALADELVTGRVWDDGLRALLAAGAAASQVSVGSTSYARDQAAEAASQLVNRVGRTDLLFGREIDPDAARSAATVLAVHMLAVQATLSLGRGETSDEELDALELPTVAEDSFGPDFETTTAVFGTQALERFTQLAASSDAGVLTLRAGLSNYQRGRADGTARVLAAGEPADRNRNQFLTNAMLQSGKLEGYFVEQIGHQAERLGRSQDDVIRMWIDISTLPVSVAAGLAERWAPIDVPFLSDALAPAADAAEDAWADHEDEAEWTAEQNAAEASYRLTYEYFAALVEHGVIEPPSGVTSLQSFADFEQLPQAVRIELWNTLVERRPFDDEVAPSGDEIELALKTQQLDVYQQLE